MNFWEAAGIGYLLGRRNRRPVQVVNVVAPVDTAPARISSQSRREYKEMQAELRAETLEQRIERYRCLQEPRETDEQFRQRFRRPGEGGRLIP